MEIRVHGAGLLTPAARRTKLIEEACRAALGPAARRPGELGVVILRRGPMRKLNREYLDHGYDTDVIAFNYKPSPPPSPASGRGGRSPASGRGRNQEPFGDVFISVDQARRQAKELGHPLLTEVLTLAIHGTLHLIGYRDSKPAERRRMFARQDRVLKRLRG